MLLILVLKKTCFYINFYTSIAFFIDIYRIIRFMNNRIETFRLCINFVFIDCFIKNKELLSHFGL